MLDHLDDVRWADLRDAKGPASEIPGLLRALAGPSSKDAAKAGLELSRRLGPDGTSTSAGAAAVPFLIEILAAPDSHHKENILDTIVGLSIGRPNDFLWAGLDPASPEYQARFEGPMGADYEAARAAARKGIPTYTALLAGGSPVVRSFAAYTLAWFSEEAADVLNALRPRLDAETEELPLASAFLAAGLQTKHAMSAGKKVNGVGVRAAHPSLAVRVASAMADYYSSGPALSKEAFEVLSSVPRQSKVDSKVFPWDDGILDRLADRALFRLFDVRPEDVWAAYERLLDSDPRTIQRLVPRAFPRSEQPVQLSSVSPLGRRVLEAIDARERIWLDVGELSMLMTERGLPTGPATLRAFLGKASSKTIVDREVTVKGEPTRTFKEWLPDVNAGLPEARAAALLAAVRDQVPAADRTSLVHHLLCHEDQIRQPLYDLSVEVLAQLRKDALSVFESDLTAAAKGVPNVLVGDDFRSFPAITALFAAVLTREAAAAGREPEARVDELLADILRGFPSPATFGVLPLLPEARREALMVLPWPNPTAPGEWPLYEIHRSPKIKDRLFAVLRRWTSDSPHYNKGALAKALSGYGDAIVPELVAAAGDKTVILRDVPLLALGKIGSHAAVTALVGFVSDRNKALKETSQKLIPELGVEKVGPALEKALASDDKALRKNAAAALGLLPNGPRKTEIAKAALGSEKVKEVKDLLAAIAGSSKKS